MSSIKSFFQSFQKLDQHHHSDLLAQPRRLHTTVPIEAAQKVVDNAYHDGMVEGALMGSGLASQVSGFAWGAMVKRAAIAAARAAVAEAEAGVIPATFYGAGAELQFGGAAALATGAATGAGAAEAGAVTLAASAAAPFILPAFLFGAGVILTSVSIGYGITHHGSHSVHGV